LKESRDEEAKRGLDWLGAFLAFGGLGSLIYGLIAASDRGWNDPWVVCSLILGPVLLVSFVGIERYARVPMMPLQVFSSLTFSGANILTLLLYGALGGALFFVPFLLIQVHGYSATETGAAFLPFTLVLALLSKWGGGLVARFGARLPLIVGPTIVAGGFTLLSLPGAGGGYWATFLLPMTVLGVGMAVTVAPLTTTVLNSVPAHQTGVASGINNAVAQVASLLLIATLGTVGITELNHLLDQHLAGAQLPSEVRGIVDSARKGFVMPRIPSEVSNPVRQAAHTIIADSFVDTIRDVLLIAATLSLASAVTAALTIRNPGASAGKFSQRHS
jgi:hypothetical protein